MLPICGGVREHELALEGLAGFLINAYGGMSTLVGRNPNDRGANIQGWFRKWQGFRLKFITSLTQGNGRSFETGMESCI